MENFEFVEKIFSSFGYLGIFFLMALESTATPVASEVVMGLAGFLVAKGIFNFFWASFYGALGSLVGSLFSYLIGLLIYEFLEKFLKDKSFFYKKLQKSKELVRDYGMIGIFVGRFLPGVRHFISFPAGFFKMNLFVFSLATFLGSFIWCSLLVLLAKNLQQFILSF